MSAIKGAHFLESAYQKFGWFGSLAIFDLGTLVYVWNVELQRG